MDGSRRGAGAWGAAFAHGARALAAILLILPPLTRGPDSPAADPWALIEVIPPTPALRSGLPLAIERDPAGRGHLDLSADPDLDEVRVHALVGAAAVEPRWQSCGELAIRIDGRLVRARLRPAAVPMEGGVYDAVTADLSILDVRAMAAARRVRLELCGEGLRLPDGASARLSEFVERFYQLGLVPPPPVIAPAPLIEPADDLPEPPEPPTPA